MQNENVVSKEAGLTKKTTALWVDQEQERLFLMANQLLICPAPLINYPALNVFNDFVD